jgi:hypothetical protein
MHDRKCLRDISVSLATVVVYAGTFADLKLLIFTDQGLCGETSWISYLFNMRMRLAFQATAFFEHLCSRPHRRSSPHPSITIAMHSKSQGSEEPSVLPAQVSLLQCLLHILLRLLPLADFLECVV